MSSPHAPTARMPGNHPPGTYLPGGHGGWRSLKVGAKLFLVAAVFTTAILVLLGSSVMILREQEATAAQADAIGRQRFLIQGYYSDAVAGLLGAPQTAQERLGIAERNLRELRAGGAVIVDLDTGASIDMPRPVPAVAKLLEEQAVALDRLSARFAELAPQAGTPGVLTDAVLAELTELRRRATSVADSASREFVAQARRDVETEVMAQMLIGALAILLGGFVAWTVTRGIVRPLQDCVGMARGIIEGNLRQPPLPVTSGDEIGVLSHTFNQMLGSLQSITQETRTTAERLAAAVAQISASIQEQAASTRQQAAAVQEITSTVEEIGQSSQQVSELARQVGGAAEGMIATGQTGLSTVRDAAAAMEAIRSQTESVAETIVAMSERTQAIGEIIATVNEIAEQSNLVALNAAIEAADAGDQGRRFAVVANEIKALADQAKDATKQVRTILEQTQKNISASVMLTEEALKRVAVGRDKALASEEAIQRMADNIQENSGSFQQVVGATGQQRIGVEQIAQGLQQIRQASVQTASSTDQLAKASTDLNQMGESLTRLFEKYRL